MSLFDKFKKTFAIDESDFVSEEDKIQDSIDADLKELNNEESTEDKIELFEINVFNKISHLKQVVSLGKVDLESLEQDLKSIEKYIESITYISPEMKSDFINQLNQVSLYLNKKDDLIKLPDYILSAGKKYYCLTEYVENNLSYVENNLSEFEKSRYTLESLFKALQGLTNSMQNLLYNYSFKSDISIMKTNLLEFEETYKQILYSISDDAAIDNIQNKLKIVSNTEVEEYLYARFSNLISNISSDSWSLQLKNLSKYLTKLEALCVTVINILEEDKKAPVRENLYDTLCSEQFILTNIWMNRRNRDAMFRALAFNFGHSFVTSQFSKNIEVRHILTDLTTELVSLTKDSNVRDLDYNLIIEKINFAGIKTIIKELNYYIINNVKEFDKFNNLLNKVQKVNNEFIISKNDYNSMTSIMRAISNGLFKIVEPIYSLQDKVKSNSQGVNISLGSGDIISASEMIDFLCDFRYFVYKEMLSLDTGDVDINKVTPKSDAIQPIKIDEGILNNFKSIYAKLANYIAKIKTYNNIKVEE